METDLHKKSQAQWKKYYDVIRCNSEKNQHVSSQHHSNLHYELEQCREDFKKLFGSHIQEYKSTGETPIRKKYKFPKTVPVVKSNDSLIEDFHKFKSNNEMIQEEIDVQEKDISSVSLVDINKENINEVF